MPSARAFVRHALRSADTPVDIIDRLVLAVAEACNNAILHAGGPAFTVSVMVDGGRAMVTVADNGAGFDPPAHPTMPSPQSTGNRGLALMRALVDEVDVVSNPSGTTVGLVQSFAARARRTAVVVDR